MHVFLAGTLIAGTYNQANNLSYKERQLYDYVENSDTAVNNLGTFVYLKEGVSRDKTDPSKTPTRNADAEMIDKIVTSPLTNQTFTDATGKQYKIINAPIATTGKDSEYVATTDINNSIINGVGFNKGTVVAEKDTNITGSIINGYKNALYLGDNTNVNLSDSTLNANGFMVNNLKPLAISGSEANNALIITGNSFINGDGDFKGGDDTLNIKDSNVKVNSKLIDMGAGDDTFVLGGNDSKPVLVGYDVINTEKLQVDGNAIVTDRKSVV